MSNIIKFDQFNISTEVRVEDGEIWFTQAQLAEFFGLSIPAISMAISSLVEEGEIEENSVVKKILITAKDGKDYKVNHYNREALYSLGYHLKKSKLARDFRAATTEVLKSLAKDGIVMDKEVLEKKKDAIEIAIDALKQIRAEESSAQKKLNAFFRHCTTDFDEGVHGENANDFYGYVQNKLHYAVHEHTAADLIVERADHTKKNMGLQTFSGKNGMPTKGDVTVAKNYLTEHELNTMNKFVNIILDCALDFLDRRMKKPAQFWYDFVDNLMRTVQRPILSGRGRYSKDDADCIALAERAKHRKLLSGQCEFPCELL